MPIGFVLSPIVIVYPKCLVYLYVNGLNNADTVPLTSAQYWSICCGLDDKYSSSHRYR